MPDIITQNLTVLPIVIPMICAAFCALVRSHTIAWCISTMAIFASLALTIMLVSHAQTAPLELSLGGHLPPQGIGYKVDAFNSVVMLLVCTIAALVILYARNSVVAEISAAKRPMFYTMFLLCFSGLLGITVTNDIFNIYVFIEISSLSTYTLISMGKNRRALIASYEYLILGTIGATFYLIGVGFIYISVGSLNITDVALRLQDVNDTTPIEVAFIFIVLGLCMKMAVFPLHMWLTESYAHAPTIVSSFLSATATKVMAYVLLRCLYTVFGFDFSFLEMLVADILVVLGLIGIMIGSLTAIYQPNAKRLLAFSSVAQLGYIILAIGIANQTGLTAAIVHLFNHALSKGLLFLCLGCIFYRIGSARITDMKGIAKAMPITMTCFVIGSLSLVGIPGTAGFISKWYMFMAIIEEGRYFVVSIFVISSLLALIYIWKIIDAAFFGENTNDLSNIKDPPFMMAAIIIIMAAMNIYTGFDTSYTLDFAQNAAQTLTLEGVRE